MINRTYSLINNSTKSHQPLNVLFLSLIITFVLIFTGCNEESKRKNSSDLIKKNINLLLYEDYQFSKSDSVIEIGVQPFALGASLISEVMRRDLILKNNLSVIGKSLKFHSFYKGPDINYFVNENLLDGGFCGSLPALQAVSGMNVTVLAATQKSFCSIVTPKNLGIEDLQNKIIGIPFGSIAHYTFIKTLNNYNIKPEKVQMKFLDVNTLSDALRNNVIDAYCAWEPIPSADVRLNSDHQILSRSLTTGFLYFKNETIKKNSNSIDEIIAAEIRAIRWMQNDPENILQAVEWTREACEKLSKKDLNIDIKVLADIALREFYHLKNNPAIDEDELTENGNLFEQYNFLLSNNLVKDEKSWSIVINSFNTEYIKKILAAPAKYSLENFRYVTDTNYEL